MAEESDPPAPAPDVAPADTDVARAEAKTDDQPEVSKPSLVDDILEWPRCGFCGSLTLHESSRGGFRESWLRWGSAGVYRCDGCNRRFAFAPLGRHRGRKGRRRDGLAVAPPLEDRMKVEDRRRRVLRATWTVVAAILTFMLAAWMINRSEQRYLEGEVQVPQPQ